MCLIFVLRLTATYTQVLQLPLSIRMGQQHMANQKQNRRRFLKTTGAGATALSAGVFSGAELPASTSVNEKLNIACVGTANRAAADISGVKFILETKAYFTNFSA